MKQEFHYKSHYICKLGACKQINKNTDFYSKYFDRTAVDHQPREDC